VKQRRELRNGEGSSVRRDDEIGVERDDACETLDVVRASFREPVLRAKLIVEKRVAGEEGAMRGSVEDDVLGLHPAGIGGEAAGQRALDADEDARVVAFRELVRASAVPRVRQDDGDRSVCTRDVAVERLEEPRLVLLPTRHERIDEDDRIGSLEVSAGHDPVVPLGVTSRPAPQPRPEFAHVHGC